jgi:Protein of unknown function (DUF973)/zinc-ribbon domain
VAGAFCAHCGKPIPPGVAFCPACGFAVAPPSPFGAYPPGFVPMRPATPTFGPADDRALRNVEAAAILALVSAAVSLVVLFSGALSSSLSVGSTAHGVNVSGLDLVVVAAAVAVTFVEVWLYRAAFHVLTPGDSRFQTPARLALVLIVALVLVVAVYAWTIELLLSVVACAGSSTSIPPSCIPGTLIGAALLLLGVAVVALVGYIGLLLGIWRLGTRYDDSKFKAGAILLIFPLLNLVGAVLILLAAHAARRPHARSAPASFT